MALALQVQVQRQMKNELSAPAEDGYDREHD
jgi:hypothetical protein